MSDNNDSSSRHLLTVVSLSFGLLLVSSALPWSKLTNNALKDFNLFEDLFPSDGIAAVTTTSSIVDPELEELMAQAENSQTPASTNGTEAIAAIDSISTDSIKEADIVEVVEAPVIDGSVGIENYSGTSSLNHFRNALAEAGSRTVRIAVIGDSYIEGDIFCAKLREILQQRYGGCGVGFIAAHNDFPGFRQSVGHKSSGWTMHDIRTMARRDSIRTLSSDYGKAAGKASISYNGRDKYANTKSWERTRFVFIAPDSGTISVCGSDGSNVAVPVSASALPQAVTLNAPVTSATISSDIAGLTALGSYLDGSTGVQVDAMSIRGNSGLGTSRINAGLCHEMAKWADYDLIIVEFGMNVLSAEQTDYTPYMTNMVKAVKHLQTCYPNADILVMGVGDRGVKIGSEVQSLPTVNAMVKAQRETARRTNTHFWDTRAAMGGDLAVVDWRKRKLLNADYIHINHAGGDELAKLFDIALKHSIDE